MIVEKKSWLDSVIDEHFEELQALWSLRQDKVMARDWFSHDLAKLDARLAAHADALVLSYPHAQAKFEEHLAGSEAQVFSACLPMLYRVDTDDILLTHLSAATAQNQLGFAYAFCCAPPFVGHRQLHRTQALPSTAAEAVALGLASHRELPIGPEILERFATPSDTPARVIDWTMLGQSTDAVIESDHLNAAWSSDDPRLQNLASVAATWSRQPWLLEYCRTHIETNTPIRLEAAQVLSLVGDAADWPLIESMIKEESLGAERLKLASNAGNPQIIPLICNLMKSPDVPTMLAASQEFRRLTGIDVSTQQLVNLPAENDNEIDEALAQQGLIPDAESAHAAWEKHRDQWSSLKRIHRGLEATDEAHSSLASADLFEQARFAMRRTFKQSSARRLLASIQPAVAWSIFAPN